ncbi:arylesterase [Celeribacter ethanolicus]|uniref:arylesterase n=1 Tax=Celeribacter ethanolicus TaxID=1758178 RepID=UPI0009D6AEFE
MGFLSNLLQKYGAAGRNGKHRLGLLVKIWVMLWATAATADPVRIAALGDSLTQGYGLVAQNGFTAQLQNWLDTHEIEATIVNAGVSGDTSAGGISRVDWTLTPDIGAMIVTLGGNDLLRGLSPDLTRANLAGILDAAKAKDIPVLLVGMQAPGNYGADYKAAFDGIYSDLAADYDTLYFEGFLKPLTDLAPWGQVLTQYMQPDGIHPNAAGVALIVEAMGPKVAELAERAGN